jgi:hypothetical protein
MPYGPSGMRSSGDLTDISLVGWRHATAELNPFGVFSSREGGLASRARADRAG